ncbi:MAG: 2-C-methyl-D-erythritol 4-phosphate cytidylyltransferase [Candidatus Omnitrophica bacterium]|nr:2-C-methyl-D-erythritol 4-phosphate cytidylyltransferase [Candidatus Omnitrophota bacterium]
MGVAAIIPAAGAGQRLGGRVRKPFVYLNGHALLAYSLKALQESHAIRWIILVARADEHAQAAALIKRHRITKALPPCVGGSSRAESVARGFASLPRGAGWVLIHDAARPCVSRPLIDRAVRSARRHGAVACGLPATLTVKAVDERREVRLTLDRDRLWFVQTPQVFRRDWFAQALARADRALSQFPDDAAILEAAGFHVRMIPGDPLNLKVTTREDLVLAEAILQRRNQTSDLRLQTSRVESSCS